jgi:Right handed beta helix region
MTLFVRPKRDCSAAACLLLTAVLVIALLGCSASASARVFFVSPQGHDRHSGRTPHAAWRSVGRVNRARLRPGDIVAFKGGSVFRDAQLEVLRSGRSGAPIRFTSYGKGRATLTRGIWFRSISWVQFDNLRLVGTANGIVSGYGSGARFIGIYDNVITRVGVAVNSAHPYDYGWVIAGNRISLTGDSGIVTQGASMLITHNDIVHTGRDRSIPWAKHGIYSKGGNVKIVGNRIVGFSAQGVSTRYHDAFISGNRIVGGSAGIAYWQQDPQAGTTVICGNTIGKVRYGVLIGPESGSHRERFRILGNHIATRGGPAVYDPGRAEMSAVRNVVSTRDAARVLRAPAQQCGASAASASNVASGQALAALIAALNRISQVAPSA